VLHDCEALAQARTAPLKPRYGGEGGVDLHNDLSTKQTLSPSPKRDPDTKSELTIDG